MACLIFKLFMIDVIANTSTHSKDEVHRTIMKSALLIFSKVSYFLSYGSFIEYGTAFYDPCLTILF